MSPIIGPLLTLAVMALGFFVMVRGALPVWRGKVDDFETKRRADAVSAAWVETAAVVTILVKFTSSGQPLEIAVGAAASLGFLVGLIFLPSLVRVCVGVAALVLVLSDQSSAEVVNLLAVAALFLVARGLTLYYLKRFG